MATYITVQQQAAQQLLNANTRQTAANRAGLAQEERARESVRSSRLPVSQVNPSARRSLPSDELSATRRRVRGFGYLDVNDCKVGAADPYFDVRYKIYAQSNVFKYRAILVYVSRPNDDCVLPSASPASFFLGKEVQLAQFVNSGGVLWVNSEYKECGISANVFNEYLTANFGATIGFVDDLQPEGVRIPLGPFTDIIRNPLSYAAQAGYAPPYYYNAATCTITGGTPYYSSAYGPVCSFERIGRGFLVLSGDSNGTAMNPSFTEGAKNFIDALLALR